MPQTQEEKNDVKRASYKNMSKKDKESLKARMRKNTTKWAREKKLKNSNKESLEKEMKELMFENQCLNNTI